MTSDPAPAPQQRPKTAPVVDAVVIGRNEGSRLVACLQSLRGRVRRIVYVDSGSQDDSVAAARTAGAEIVELDLTLPFTAARARNAGIARIDADPGDFVQLVDGDCTVTDGWIETATEWLAAQPGTAVVCGRRREINPQTSVFNRLCDHEWNTPVGPARACGGDALMRLAALHEVAGFRDDLIAGEEPELCVRLRARGWQIMRLDAEMTRHDANILHVRQWWRRARRTGHAYAEGAAIHGGPPERHWVRERNRAVGWAMLAPVAVGLAVLWPPALLLLLVYPAQVLRLTMRSDVPGPAVAALTVAGKLPEAWGVAGYHLGRLLGRRSALIEYK